MMENRDLASSKLDGDCRDIPETNIHRIFEENIAKAKTAEAIKTSKIALRYCNESITFAELNNKANILARNLVQQLKYTTPMQWELIDGGHLQSIIIGILVPHGIVRIIALFGILKAGAAYLPLDEALPLEQTKRILDDAGCTTVITTTNSAAYLKNVSIQIVNVDRLLDKAQLGVTKDEDITQNLSDDEMLVHDKRWDASLCCLLYTSGSTGKPKGVLLTHKNAIHSIWGCYEWFPAADMEVHVHFLSLRSVAHLMEIYVPLLKGVELVVIPAHLKQDLDSFVDYLETYNVTHAFAMVPALLQNVMVVLNSSPAKRLSKLRSVGTGSEIVPPDLVRSVLKYFEGRCSVTSVFGMTETACFVLGHRVNTVSDLAAGKVPVGKPLPNNKVYILDENMQSVPEGTVGEIYIGGSNVMPSYTDLQLSKGALKENKIDKDPKYILQTRDFGVFVKGLVYYEGRANNFLKVRAFKVSTVEIEQVLATVEGIKHVAVIGHAPAATDQTTLVAFYSCLPGYMITPRQMAIYGKDNLANYMIPRVFVLDELPTRQPQGKTDYPCLKSMYEQKLAAIRAQHKKSKPALGDKPAELKYSVAKCLDIEIDEIDLEDDFFDLGGSSTNLTQLWSQLREFGWKVTISQLLSAGSLHEMLDMQNLVDVEYPVSRDMLAKFSIVKLHDQDDEEDARLLMVEGYRTKRFHTSWVAFRRGRPLEECESIVNSKWELSKHLNLSLAVRNMETGRYAAVSLLTEYTFNYKLAESRSFSLSDKRAFIKSYILDVNLPFAKKVATLGGRTLHAGQFATDPSLSDADVAGIASLVLKRSTELAKENGFARMHAETTIPFMQALLFEAGAVKENEIVLKNYEYMGKRPWADNKEIPDDASHMSIAIYFDRQLNA